LHLRAAGITYPVERLLSMEQFDIIVIMMA